MKQLMTYRPFLIASLVMFAVLGAFGQETWEKEGEGEIKDLEIELTKERQLTLPRANRYFEKVPPRAFEPIVPAITYDVRNFSFKSPNFIPAIRPLRVKQEELARLSGNYVSGGIGNYTSFLAEGSISTKRDKKKLLGADFFWRGFGQGPVDGDNSASSNTRVALYGKSVTDAVTFTGDLNYTNQRGYFYSYAPATDVSRDNLKQMYETFAARVGAENTKPGEFNYKTSLVYSYLKDNLVSSEGELSLSFDGKNQLKNGNRILLHADVFLINRKDSLFSNARNLIRIQPAYEFVPLEKLTIVAGLNLAFSNDDFNGTGSSLNAYPHVNARYQASDRVMLYGTLTGNLDKVNLHTLSAENFWLNSNNPMVHTNRAFELDGGLQTTLGRNVTAKLGASYATLKNLYFYQAVRDGFDLAGKPAGVAFDKFDLLYDKSTGRFNPYGEVSVTASDKLNLSLRMDYFNYSTEVLPAAWHRPTYRGDFRIHYDLFNKIYLSAGLIVQGGMKAVEPVTGIVRTLDTAADLNFKGRYFFSRQLSAFVQLDNILSTQYPIYLGYPARGFQAMVGLSWSL